MNEIVSVFIDGLVLGFIISTLVYKIIYDLKIKKQTKTIENIINKLLTETKEDLPIESEEELL